MVHHTEPRFKARNAHRVLVLAGAIAVVPFVVAAIAVLVDGPDAFIRDHALMELRVRDVGRHPVLIGLYSRDGWSHPGPLIFYALAIPYRLLGSNPSSLLVGALVINAASIVGMAMIARRVAGTAAALFTLIAASLVARAMGPELLRDPWVCFVTVLPFGVFCLLVWAITLGFRWALPGAVVVASWLVQTHVGYAPLTVPLVVAGVAWVAFRAWRHDRLWALARESRYLVLGTVILGTVLWVPTLWDQLFGSGNLSTTTAWFSDPGAEETHTILEGARIVAAQFAIVPDWISGERRIDEFSRETTLRFTAPWPLLVPLVATAAVLAWRNRQRAVVHLAFVLAALTLCSVIAISRTVGLMYEYRLLWTWVVGALAGVLVALTAWRFLVSRWPGVNKTVLSYCGLGCLGVLSVVNVFALTNTSRPDWESPELGAILDELTTELRTEQPGEIVLRSESHIGGWYLHGLLLGLERRGFDARVADDPVDLFGDHRVGNRNRVVTRLLVLGGDDINGFVAPPGLDLLAYRGPIPLEARADLGARADETNRRLLEAFRTGTIDGHELARGLAATKVPGPTIAVFREPVAR